MKDKADAYYAEQLKPKAIGIFSDTIQCEESQSSDVSEDFFF